MTDRQIITNIKDLKLYLKHLLETEIQHRENDRGTGVFLAENIGSYYCSVGAIHALQDVGRLVGIDEKLLSYNPDETEENDTNYDYWNNSQIGMKEGE